MSYRNSPRCSHCWTTGHTKNHCPEIKKLAEQGVSWAVEHIRQQKLSVLNRKCSYCGEKGHNKRSCKHKKEDKSVYESTNNRFIRQQLNEMKYNKVTVGSLVSFSPRNSGNTPPTIGLMTKWNFLKYKPGLVGGHCISVDPYYLAYKAENLGYHPEVILSGRRVNDNMSTFVVNKMIKMLIRAGKQIMGSKILILGVTFKENCPDVRNSKVFDVFNELKEFGLEVDAYDYEADQAEVKDEYGINLIDEIKEKYDGILLAVAHNKFSEIDILSLKKDPESVVFDLKGFLPRSLVNARL